MRSSQMPILALILAVGAGCAPEGTEDSADLPQDTAGADEFEVDEDDGPETSGAAAWATCSGSGCSGKDPVSYGCDSSASTIETKTVYSSGSYWIKVDLRYSSSCGTNWARMRTNYSSSKSVSMLLDTSSSDRSKSGSITSASNLWTTMEYCPTGSCVALACGYYGTKSACTGSW